MNLPAAIKFLGDRYVFAKEQMKPSHEPIPMYLRRGYDRRKFLRGISKKS
jgi:hypothetical protein